MTERMALRAGEHLPWRRLLLAALVPVLVAGALSLRLGADRPSTVPATPPSHAGTRAELANLSPAAQASISGAVGAKEPAYLVRATAGALRAENPGQHLGITFARSGAMLDTGGLKLGLRLRAVGYGSALSSVSTGAPVAAANRVTYRHAGISEWFVNGTLGLEQGFTLAHPPGTAAGGPLTLAIALSGDADPTLAAGGQSATFSDATGSALRYGGLSASDATGRALKTWLALDRGELLLRVDTAGAHFPLRIDPTIQQEPEVKLLATLDESSEDAHLGRSVAISADGNTALAGAPGGNIGAGWVFTRSGTSWQPLGTKLAVPAAESEATGCSEEPGEPTEGPEECGLGWSVSLSADGQTALLGAPHAHDQNGAAWIFTRSGATWTESAELSPPESVEDGHFGRSVALSADGDTAIAGAPTAGSGRAWAFARTGETWSPVGQTLQGSGEVGDSRFGRSVAVSADGDMAIVGGPGDAEDLGAVWAYDLAGSTWVAQGAKLTGAGEAAAGRFGFSVALSGDASTALIGSYGDHGGQGGAWVFTRTGSLWIEQGSELSGGDEGEELFGYSVALSPGGDSALIGAPRANGRGAAWLYQRSGSSWSAEKKLVGGTTETGTARFGSGVALSSDGTRLLVGGPDDKVDGGAAWVFGPAPSVEAVTPHQGPIAGGTTVRIGGEHLAGVTAVRFGASPAVSFSVESEQSISAVSPPGTGTVDVTVEAGSVQSATSPFDQFTYKVATNMGPGPFVQEISPKSGPSTGGTAVRITGENLAAASAVRFGQNAAASFTAESENSITAVAPPGTGTVDVTVESESGESATRLDDRFTYEGGEPPSKGPGKNKTPLAPPPGTTETLASGPTSGGLLSSIPGPGCGVKLLSKAITVQGVSRAIFKLAGTGLGSCSGKLRLRAKIKLPHRHSSLKTIGTATFALLPGKHLAVKVHLNAAGRRLLAAGHGRLNASVLLVRSLPAPTQAHTASVRLRVQKAPKTAPARK